MNKEKVTGNNFVITILNTDPGSGKVAFINGTPFPKSCGDVRTPEQTESSVDIS